MVEPTVTPGVVVKCPECDTTFLCGVQSEDCWCWDIPAKAVRATIGAECLCRDCLTR